MLLRGCLLTASSYLLNTAVHKYHSFLDELVNTVFGWLALPSLQTLASAFLPTSVLVAHAAALCTAEARITEPAVQLASLLCSA